jgi:hypothetical protein
LEKKVKGLDFNILDDEAFQKDHQKAIRFFSSATLEEL